MWQGCTRRKKIVSVLLGHDLFDYTSGYLNDDFTYRRTQIDEPIQLAFNPSDRKVDLLLSRR